MGQVSAGCSLAVELSFSIRCTSILVKMLLAIIRPTKLQDVRDALKSIGVKRMTVCDSHGFGRQRGQRETFRGIEYSVSLLQKVVLEIVVNDDFVDKTVQTIEHVARTGSEGSIGDGKIFVLPIDTAVRLDDSASGPEAV